MSSPNNGESTLVGELGALGLHVPFLTLPDLMRFPAPLGDEPPEARSRRIHQQLVLPGFVRKLSVNGELSWPKMDGPIDVWDRKKQVDFQSLARRIFKQFTKYRRNRFFSGRSLGSKNIRKRRATFFYLASEELASITGTDIQQASPPAAAVRNLRNKIIEANCVKQFTGCLAMGSVYVAHVANGLGNRWMQLGPWTAAYIDDAVATVALNPREAVVEVRLWAEFMQDELFSREDSIGFDVWYSLVESVRMGHVDDVSDWLANRLRGTWEVFMRSDYIRLELW